MLWTVAMSYGFGNWREMRKCAKIVDGKLSVEAAALVVPVLRITPRGADEVLVIDEEDSSIANSKTGKIESIALEIDNTVIDNETERLKKSPKSERQAVKKFGYVRLSSEGGLRRSPAVYRRMEGKAFLTEKRENPMITEQSQLEIEKWRSPTTTKL